MTPPPQNSGHRLPPGEPLAPMGQHWDDLAEDIEQVGKLGIWSEKKDQLPRWSPGMFAVFELSPRTIVGDETWRRLADDRSQNVLEEAKKLCFEEGKPFDLELPLITAKGAARWVRIRGKAVVPGQANTQIRGIAQDVTEERQSTLDNQQLADRLRSIAANSPGMIYQYRMSPEGEPSFEYVSDKGFDIFGVTPAEFRSNSAVLQEKVIPEDQAGLEESILESARTLTLWTWEGRILTHEGVKWIKAQSFPKQLNDGSVVWDGVLMDTTSAKSLQAALEEEQLKSFLSARLAALGEMAGGIAHEINNPLAIIQGRVEVIRRRIERNDSLEKIKDDTEKILHTCRRIFQIVKGMKNLLRNPSGDEMEDAQVQQVLQDVVSLCAEKCRNRGVTLHLEAPDLPIWIRCLPSAVGQVLLNLVSNSLDAVVDLPLPWIRIGAVKDRTSFHFFVQDSGDGLPEEIVHKVMTPFFTTKVRGRGTGLGLSISKSIAERHGGDLWYEQNAPHTLFCFSLPLDSVIEDR